MAMTEPDLGRKLRTAVAEWGERNAVPVLAGQVELGGGDGRAQPLVFLDIDEAKDEDIQLTSILDQLHPQVIVIDCTQLEGEDIDDAVERLTAQGADPIAVEKASACRRKVGHISTLDLSAFILNGTVIVRHTFSASWYDDLFATDAAAFRVSPEDAERQARWAADQRERTKWTVAARSTAARKVAGDSRFAQAKTEAARVLITRETLGADAPENEHILKEIGRAAKAVFDLEIKPRK